MPTDRYYNPRPQEGIKLYRTYRFLPSTVRRIDDVSSELSCFQSQLIENLLLYAFDQIDAGKLTVGRKPVKFEVHLE